MKKIVAVLLILCFCYTLFAQAEVEFPAVDDELISFKDDAGRAVQIKSGITRVAPSGAVATMMLAALAPEYLCSVNSMPSKSQLAFLPPQIAELPATGQLYGGKSTLNAEELLMAQPEVIIDIGDFKKNIGENMDSLQMQLGVPCIFLEGDLQHMANAFRTLGSIIEGKSERAEEIASFIDKTIEMAKEKSSQIPADKRISVMFTTGKDGLGTNPRGSAHSQVIDLIGADNAIVVDRINPKGGGNPIDMEQLYRFNPEVILFSAESIYKDLESLPDWSALDAIKEGRFYEIPSSPYNWMSNPTSMNMVLGIWWLGNLLYPEYYDYNMIDTVKEIYQLFWNYSLSDEEAKNLLASSTLKR